MGGAQAIAAMAFGTDTMPRVDRIVGPGNIYVAAAKKLLAGEVGIDFVAGPTEILILSADDGNASVIAADMLAQAEHDTEPAPFWSPLPNSWPTQSRAELKKQLSGLPTARCCASSRSSETAPIILGARY